MSQGYDSTKPSYLAGLSSSEMRTNLNALCSHHSGDTAPTDILAGTGQTWLDTTSGATRPDVLKIYNSDTTSWQTLFVNIKDGETPLASGVLGYPYDQSASAINPWPINHGFNKRVCSVTVVNTSYVKIAESNYTVTYTDADNLSINFSGGNQDGHALIQ